MKSNGVRTTFKNRGTILDTIEKNNHTYSLDELYDVLKADFERVDFNYAVANFLLAKKLDFDEDGKLFIIHNEKDFSKDYEYVICKIKITKKNFGIARSINETNNNIYIEREDIKNSINNDIILVKATDQDLEKNQNFSFQKKGNIEFIIERKTKVISAVFKGYLKNKQAYFVPFVSKFPHKIRINNNHVQEKLIINKLYLLKIIDNDYEHINCEIVKEITSPHKKDIELLAIAYDKQVTVEFEQETLKEAEKLDFKFSEAEDAKRVDLQDLAFVTIDPKTSKDMDDAIYVSKTDDGYKLYVAIADVSYYVDLNSSIWKDALKKGSSIYMIDLVLPMLPFKLSNEICSLNPNAKRYALVCEMDLDKNGNYLNQKVYAAIVKSKNKFAYEDVNNYFEKKTKLEHLDDSVYQMLDNAYELYEILSQKRRDSGYIDFNIKKVEIIMDELGTPIDIVLKSSKVAEKLIENFMIAANESVTEIFINKKDNNKPFIFRTHDVPKTNKFEIFVKESQKLHFKVDFGLHNLTPIRLSHWLNQFKNEPNVNLLNDLLLKTMAKAKYQTKNIGHFGLGLKYYTHFTSPIRRIADTLVHMLLRAFVFEDQSFYSEKEKKLLENNLDHYCQIANYTEVDASYCEWDANSFKFAEYLVNKIGSNFKGVVNYVTKFGFYVQLDNTIEGFVPLKLCHMDYFDYNKNDFTLVGKRSGLVITLGTKVRVRLEKSVPNTSTIEFSLLKVLD